uniref:Uncharacterized protein n=1 Tax=Vibrio cholerae TaxID=666 RepID=Q0GPC6_VIBCL|nr:hypothetical protein [Vibrio cholerae]ABI30060.1 unknown [Vibrio cholerae]
MTKRAMKMTKDISNYNMRWVEDDPLPDAVAAPLSPRERYLNQLRENHRQADENWAYVQANEERYAAHRENIVAKRLLDIEAHKATTELLAFLPTLNLASSVHSKAVKEFSEAFNVILKGHNEEKITYDVGYDLIHQIKNGFIEGGEALKSLEENRQTRVDKAIQESSYRRNMVVNNESFNVRFKASCATSECLMRNANIDMQDEAFQDYIEAATKDKRSDVMQVINVALIANPYLAPLQRVVQADVVYSAANLDFDPLWAYATGMGAAYRLRLLNLPKRVQDTSESVVSYFSGNILSGD